MSWKNSDFFKRFFHNLSPFLIIIAGNEVLMKAQKLLWNVHPSPIDGAVLGMREEGTVLFWRLTSIKTVISSQSAY